MPPIDLPSNRISPAVGAISFMIIRPVVVLPQPDSPTSPTVSPRRMSKLMPSTARTAAGGPLAQSPRRTGKCLTRFLTSSSLGCSSGAPDGAAIVMSLLREQAANRPPVAAGLDERHVARLALRTRPVAARREGTSGGQVRGIGRAPLDRHQPLVGAPELGQRVDEPARVGMSRVLQHVVHPALLHDLARVHDHHPVA